MKLSRGLVRNFLNVVADPTRTDLIFKVITAPEILTPEAIDAFLARIRQDEKSRIVLNERFEKPWRVEELAKLPQGTLGYAYARHMIDNHLDADFFDNVPGASDRAYVQMRMRRTHDIWHVLTGFDTSIPGEVGLQAFQQAQYGTRSSAAIISMFLLNGVATDGESMNATTAAVAKGWLMGVACKPLFGEKFEELWSRNLDQYRMELGLIENTYSNYSTAPCHQSSRDHISKTL